MTKRTKKKKWLEYYIIFVKKIHFFIVQYDQKAMIGNLFAAIAHRLAFVFVCVCVWIVFGYKIYRNQVVWFILSHQPKKPMNMIMIMHFNSIKVRCHFLWRSFGFVHTFLKVNLSIFIFLSMYRFGNLRFWEITTPTHFLLKLMKEKKKPWSWKIERSCSIHFNTTAIFYS